jgi:hypothetical protein
MRWCGAVLFVVRYRAPPRLSFEHGYASTGGGSDEILVSWVISAVETEVPMVPFAIKPFNVAEWGAFRSSWVHAFMPRTASVSTVLIAEKVLVSGSRAVGANLA